MILPYVLDFYGDSVSTSLARLADLAGVARPGQDDAMKARTFVESIRELNRRMNIPATFEQIKAEDIPLIVQRALREAHPLYPVPKFMTAADCEKVVRLLRA